MSISFSLAESHLGRDTVSDIIRSTVYL